MAPMFPLGALIDRFFKYQTVIGRAEGATDRYR